MANLNLIRVIYNFMRMWRGPRQGARSVAMAMNFLSSTMINPIMSITQIKMIFQRLTFRGMSPSSNYGNGWLYNHARGAITSKDGESCRLILR